MCLRRQTEWSCISRPFGLASLHSTPLRSDPIRSDHYATIDQRSLNSVCIFVFAVRCRRSWGRYKNRLSGPLSPFKLLLNKKAQLSLTNPRDAKARQKLLQFDVLTTLSLIILVYLHSFSCEIPRNFLKIQTYRVQNHPRSSILVSMESPYVTSY